MYCERRFCRLHFEPCEEFDSTNALFNGAMIDVSSGNLAEIDPIIDIVPEISNSVPDKAFVPLSTVSSVIGASSLLHTPHPRAATLTTSSASALQPTPSLSTNNRTSSYESHQKHLHALKVG